MEALKECPFCGKVPKIPGDFDECAYTEDGEEYAIHCFPGCGASGGWVECDIEDWENSLPLLTAAWNTRPSTGEAEALRSLLEEGACFAEAQRYRTKGIKGKEQAFKVADEYLGRLEATLQRDKKGR